MPCIHRKLQRTCVASMKQFMRDTFREKRVFRVLFSASTLFPFMRKRIQRLQFCNYNVIFLDENMERKRLRRYQCHMQWHNMEIHMFLQFEGEKKQTFTKMTIIPDTTQEQLAYVDMVKECMRKERKKAIKAAKKEFARRKKKKPKNTRVEPPVQFKCCICQEEHMTNLCALQCGHVMHSKCAARCKHCPICKQEVKRRTKLYI